MNYGFCTWLLTGTLPERVRFIAENAMESVSLLQTVMEEDPADRIEAARLICEYDLNVTYHGNVQEHLRPDGSPDPDFVRRMLDDVLWWQERTGRVYSCLSDSINRSLGGDGEFCYEAEATRALFETETAFFRGSGIRCGIENFLTGNSFAPPARLRRFRQEAEMTPEAGMLFDVGHANIFIREPEAAGISLETYIEQLPFRIHEVHISDNSGRRDEHLPPGRGSVDYAALAAALRRRGEQPVITLEFCPDILHGRLCWNIGEEEDRATIRGALALIKQIFGASAS